MKLSASTELLWQLAGKEAIAAKFKEIEPEHFWMALLKFAELPVEQTEKIAAGAEAAKQLAADVRTLRDALAKRNIDCTRARREIRAKLGQGKHAFDGGQIHRAPASRDLFDAAARMADEMNEVITPNHLFQALLIAPSDYVREVLGEAAQASKLPLANTPLLNEHHKDLNDPSGHWQEREVEKNALVQALAQPKCRCVFFVSDNDRHVSSVVFNLAHTLSKCAETLKDHPVFNLVALKPAGQGENELLDLWERLFAEATGTHKAILYIPPLEMSEESRVREWLHVVKEWLGKGGFRCVGRISPEVYLKWIKPDPAWRSLSQSMWIQRESQMELPREL